MITKNKLTPVTQITSPVFIWAFNFGEGKLLTSFELEKAPENLLAPCCSNTPFVPAATMHITSVTIPSILVVEKQFQNFYFIINFQERIISIKRQTRWRCSCNSCSGTKRWWNIKATLHHQEEIDRSTVNTYPTQRNIIIQKLLCTRKNNPEVQTWKKGCCKASAAVGLLEGSHEQSD